MDPHQILSSPSSPHDPGASAAAPGPRAFLVVALVLTTLAYIGAARFGFVYDDVTQIQQNPRIQSWQSVPSYFTTHVWGQLRNVLGNYYRPLFLLWLRLNHALFGLNPLGWHLSTIVLHLAATIMVWRLARKVSGDAWLAVFAAFVFGLHPVHVEAVTWISGGTEPLLALTLMGAFICYLHAAGAGRTAWRWRAASVVLFALALLAKETAVVFPLLILLHAWLPSSAAGAAPAFAARLRASLWASLPLWILVVAYLPIRMFALHGFSHGLTPLSLPTLVFTLPSVLFLYLRLLILPVGLSLYYDLPLVTHPGFRSFVLPLVALAGLAALLWIGWRRWRSQAFAVGLLWLVLPLLPLLNLAMLPEWETVHDRYLYLPSVGFSILVALALRSLPPGSRRLFGQPAAQLGSVLAIALLLGAATARQTAFWATDLLLFSRAVEIAPGNVRARVFLANALLNRGDTELGIRLHRQLLERFPDVWYSNASLGIAYYGIGKYGDADRHLSRAIRTDPNADSSLFLYLGVTRMAEGDLSQAQAAIEHAIGMDPGAPGYRLWLGEVMERRGDLARALELYRSEAALQPANPEPRERAQRLAQRLPDRNPSASPAEKEP